MRKTPFEIVPRPLFIEGLVTDSAMITACRRLMLEANARSTEWGGMQHLLRYGFHRLTGMDRKHPVLEIGTYRGGSALAWMAAIALTGNSRPLITVDPYGGLPYTFPDGTVVTEYNDDIYREMLASVSTSALEFKIPYVHYKVSDEDYMEKIHPTVPLYTTSPPRPSPQYALVYLDAQHEAVPVCRQVEWALRNLAPKGSILIDDAFVGQVADQLHATFADRGLHFLDIGGTRPFVVIEPPASEPAKTEERRGARTNAN